MAGGDEMVEVFARTWRQIILEREVEIGPNAAYRKAFEDGMPISLLDEFETNFIHAGREALRKC